MANYFSHDSNARNSDKLIRLRMQHKAAGYGVYFMILERLREEPGYMSVKDYNMIAFDLREDASLIKSVVEDFGLFVFTEDGKYFYSESLCRRMGIKDEKSVKARESANKRWEKKRKEQQSQGKESVDIMQTQCECNAKASNQGCECNAIKKRKGKENIIDFPSDEVKSSFPSNEEKASNSPAGEVQNSGNGGFGGSSETLAAEADSANGFANPSNDALVGEAAPDEKLVSHERESGDSSKENPQPDKILNPEDEKTEAGKKTVNPEALAREKIPYQEIVDMFNSICTGYSRVMKLSEARKKKIRIRVEEMGGFAKAKPMIQTIFEKMQESKFLRGDNRRGWKAYFDWIFENDKNWVKILEGNYDNRSSKNSGTNPAADGDDAELMRHVAAGIARGMYERQQRANGGEPVPGQ